MKQDRARLRVAHLVLSLDIGGPERVILDLVRHTDRQTFEQRVLCLREPGALQPLFAREGNRVESLDLSGPLRARAIVRLVQWLREFRPHVLHTHNRAPHLLGALAAQVAGVPAVVHTKHGRGYFGSRRKIAMSWLAALLSNYVVAVSENAAQVARRLEHVPARKIVVIHNGIDLADYLPPPSARNRDGMRALHVARLVAVKDQATLLRAVRLVVDREARFQLDVAGDGPERASLVQLQRELRLEGHVHFLGFRSDVGTLLQSANLFVMSSIGEGISLTLLEAMACELPVITTDVGGNREVVDPGRTGLLVPAGRPEILAETILGVLRDPERASQMGRAGRQRVEEAFDSRRMVASYEQLYLSVRPRGRGQDP